MSMFDRAMNALAVRAAKAIVETRAAIRPVGSTSWGTSALQLTRTEQRWTASAIAYRCILAISSNASSLRLQVVREDGSEIEGHDLSRLWSQPNPLMSGRTFGEYLWQRMETRGETFVYLDRGDSGVGRIAGMWPIFGDVNVFVDKNLAGEIVGYEVNVSGKIVPLLPSEVLWLRYPDAENEWGSIAPLVAAAHAIGLDAHARAWQKGELANGARPSSVIYLGDLDEEQHNKTVDAYRSKIEGPNNAGRSLFVSSKMRAKVERMTLTPAELGWMDTRSSAWEEIMVAWGIPKDYLLGGTTYENRDAARSTVWSDALIPRLEIVAGEIARQLLNPGERARFDTDDVEALQESADGKVNRAAKVAELDGMTLDELRAVIGLDELPNGTGALTITAYRAAVQLEAQSMLLQVDPAARQLQGVTRGPLQLGRAATTALALPSLRTRAGLTFDQAQAEYAHHEKIGVRAIKRLAGKQEAIVLANLHKLFGRSGTWAAEKRELDEAVAVWAARVVEAFATDNEAAALVTIRAKVDKLLDAEKAQQMTREQLDDFLTALWSRGGETTAAELGLSFDLFHESVLDAMADRAERLAEQVTKTTRAVLEDAVLVKGVAEGETVDELAARVRAAYSDLSTWRATTIARTETVGGFNGASYLTAKSSDVVTARVWLATGDSRTRDSHVAADGERVTGWDQAYSNGCLHPGNGPAEETIMCRCVETYETD